MKTFIFISLLIIFVIYKKYVNAVRLDVLNIFKAKTSSFEYSIYKNMKAAKIPEAIIHNVQNAQDIKNILKFIDIVEHDNHLAIDQIKKYSKVVIVISGENGSGKTNLMFQLNHYFSDSHDIILATLDNYKKNYHEFMHYASNSNASIFYPIKDVVELKKLFTMYLADFLISQYSMLIIDTSGRSAGDQNLQREMYSLLNFISLKCAKNNIASVFLYNLSGLKHLSLPKQNQQYNYCVISQIDHKYLQYDQIKQLNDKHKLLFLSMSNNFSELYLYNNILMANMIAKKMQDIVSNTNDKKQ